MNKKKINIILPNRIGDSILSLPSVLCLKQLVEKYNSGKFEITILPPKSTFPVIKSLNLCKTRPVSIISKIKSWINTPDMTLYLCNSSKNLGFKSKKSCGPLPAKSYLKYSEGLTLIDMDETGNFNPKYLELIDFLKNERQLSLAAVKYFGYCVDLGYSIEQIKSTFEFSPDSLNINKEFSSWKPSFGEKYIVMCMEAAYGRRTDFNRRWKEENFFELAEKIYENFKIPCVFVGLENKPALPEKSYFIDLRGKLNTAKLSQLVRFSECYVGNDTGPLHLTNLMKRPTVCIGLIPAADIYRPLFGSTHHLVWNPQSPDEIINVLNTIFA